MAKFPVGSIAATFSGDVATFPVGSVSAKVFLATFPGVATFLVVTRRGSSKVGAPLRNLGKFVYPALPVSFG